MTLRYDVYVIYLISRKANNMTNQEIINVISQSEYFDKTHQTLDIRNLAITGVSDMLSSLGVTDWGKGEEIGMKGLVGFNATHGGYQPEFIELKRKI